MNNRFNIVTVDPLQNDEILEQIFKYVQFKDLLSCRQVCRAWRRESAKAMRSCAKVAVYLFDDTSPIKNFLELIKSKESIYIKKPFANSYKISSLMKKPLNIQRFWNFCGNQMKTLHLSHVKFPNVNAFLNVVQNRCPNLENLTLEQISVGYLPSEEPSVWVPPRFPQNWNLKTLKIYHFGRPGITWMEILAHFPAIENLDAKSTCSGCSIDDMFFHSLAIARMHNDQCWKLKSLEINLHFMRLLPELVSLLENGNLALEKLKISELFSFINSNPLIAIQRMLNSQSGSLKILRFGTLEKERSLNILPVLENIYFEKVEELEFVNLPVPSTKFLRSVPNLERLKLIQIPNAFEQDDFDEDNWSLPNCTELELNLKAGNPEKLWQLWRRLPNVKTLKLVGVGNRMFSVVCGLWEDLTFLSVSKSWISDSGISGFDESDVKKINQRGAARPWRPKTVTRANLTSLKILKSFHWESNNNLRLHYCAAVYGTQQLPQSVRLRMDGYS